jgi:hypothetical protein
VGVLDRSNGSYAEERLYVLARLEQLAEQGNIDREAVAKFGDRLSKFQKDVHEAHARIRELQGGKKDVERRLTRLEIRAGYIAAGVGLIAAAVATAIVEAVSKWIHH